MIGHRGKGMNALASPDERMREVKENSVRSFNEAARVAGVGYVEFESRYKSQPQRSVNMSSSQRRYGCTTTVEVRSLRVELVFVTDELCSVLSISAAARLVFLLRTCTKLQTFILFFR